MKTITRSRQQGAILVVSLLLLLVMTVLALSASNTTRLQEKMAGNARDLDLAFQGAEAGLRFAERELQKTADKAGLRFLTTGTNPLQDILDRPATPIDYSANDETWWNANARAYGDPAVQELTQLVTDPLARTELRAQVSDTLSEGGRPGSKPGVAYFQSTSRAVGGTETAEVVVQSTVAVPYVE
jgi:type IV pilus assembly protein PilX